MVCTNLWSLLCRFVSFTILRTMTAVIIFSAAVAAVVFLAAVVSMLTLERFVVAAMVHDVCLKRHQHAVAVFLP